MAKEIKDESVFKVVRVDKAERCVITEAQVDAMAKFNIELTKAVCSSEEEIVHLAQDADAILTTRGTFTRKVMERLPKCKLIIRDGVGYETIDADAATDNNIIVANCPAGEWCLEEVSNHVITLLLSCAKKIVYLNENTRQGRWKDMRGTLSPMGPIIGETFGLIGFGEIARRTAEKAQCLGLSVISYDPYLDKSIALQHSITLVGKQELFKQSDYISVHTVLNDETFHLVGEQEFKQMKTTSYIINTARGPIIDEAALIKALHEGWIAGAGLDVFENEPVDPKNPLLEMGNVILTPHTAYYSDLARDRQKGIISLQEAVRIHEGHWPKNVINRGVKPKIELTAED